MRLVSERGDSRRLVVVSATIALAVFALLALAGRAQAVETLYWNNYSDDPDTIAFANIDGLGGGTLDLTGVELDGPEGMAVDPVTGRLYIATVDNGPDEKGQIVFANLSGGGGGVFTAPGAPVDEPEGLTIDPVARTIYWINTGPVGSIAWAKLDGSVGGTLSTTGAVFEEPYRLAVDPVAGRVYWGSVPSGPGSKLVISYANVNNTGGGNLNINGSTPSNESTSGIAVDPAGGRVYWLNEESDTVSYASLSNTGGGDLDTSSASWDGPYGLALDPGAGRAYWANYGGGEESIGAFGIGSIPNGGPGSGINIATAPVAGPQDPIILKSPTGTGAPLVTKSAANRASLTCSTGNWAPDYAGSFVYQAPVSFAYQWTLNGQPVAGATAASLTARAPGAYACAVTGRNVSGTATQSAAAVTVKVAKVKLSTKKKAKADPGDRVTFRLKAVNQGDLPSKKARICVKLPKAAKADLKAPKCKRLARLNGQARKTIKLRIKVKPGADEGTDKLTFQVKGTAGKAAKSKIVVR